MKAAVFYSPHNIKIIDKEVPQIKEDEVLVKVEAAGVCGTDIHIYHGTYPASPPVVPCHEFAGLIVQVGSKVKHLKVGDRISADPNISCNYCSYCLKGSALCKNMVALGVNIDGGFQEYCAVPSSQAHKLPDNVSCEQGAFVEPVNVCIRAMDILNIKVGDTVVIIGAGVIGLIMLQMVKICGAHKVIVSDPVQSKLEKARLFGADVIVNPGEKDLVAAVSELSEDGADIAIECVGSVKTDELALSLVKSGGKVMWFGVSPQGQKVMVEAFECFRKELSIYGSNVSHNFPRAIDLISTGRIKVEPLLTNIFGLDDIFKALEVQQQGEAVKVQIKP